MAIDWIPVGADDPPTPGDYLFELGPFPVALPPDIPGFIIAGVGAAFAQYGYTDVNMRGDGERLFISFRVPG